MNNLFRVWWMVALWAITTLPFLTRLTRGRTSYDIEHYWTSAGALLGGAIPYADFPLEYPLYSVIGFVAPAVLSSSLAEFRLAFGLLIWAIDAGVKGLLLWQIPRTGTRKADFVPIGLYVLGTAALGHLLLQRYDVIPAALSLAAVVALWRGWMGSAGALVALAAGAKAYPALYIPVMAVHAWRRSRTALARFTVGLLLALMPLVVAAWWVPWWRFLSSQTNRGLQVESLWASLVWMLHFAGVPARWEFVSAWYEVTGTVAASMVGPARAVWILATLLSLARATLAAAHLPAPAQASDPEGPGEGYRSSLEQLASLARLLLLPAVSFVAFSPFLSPQFHLWLLPWCALALAGRDGGSGSHARLASRAVWAIFLGTLVVPVFYPSPTYSTGLDAGRTAALLLRNGLLVYASVCLWRSASRQAISSESPASHRALSHTAHPRR